MAATAEEDQRKLMYKKLSITPNDPVEDMVIKKMLKMIAQRDATAKKPMDSYIMQQIDGPNGDAVKGYAQTYKKIRETVGGKTKKSKVTRKTRRNKKLNGRK